MFDSPRAKPHAPVMQISWVVCLAAVLIAAWWSGAGAADAVLRIGGGLPSVVLRDIKGATIRIPGDIRGKVLILHFWQAGCSSCKLEMPAMDNLYATYRRKGLEILAVNVGQKKETVQASAGELGVSYPLLIDADRKGSTVFGVTDVPRTYIIDRSGIVRYRIFGGASPALLKKLIRSLL
jgi:cytochrome c biogenesis protein CcmG, thiol:disulfide interchange protein DsbE